MEEDERDWEFSESDRSEDEGRENRQRENNTRTIRDEPQKNISRSENLKDVDSVKNGGMPIRGKQAPRYEDSRNYNNHGTEKYGTGRRQHQPSTYGRNDRHHDFNKHSGYTKNRDRKTSYTPEECQEQIKHDKEIASSAWHSKTSSLIQKAILLNIQKILVLKTAISSKSLTFTQLLMNQVSKASLKISI